MFKQLRNLLTIILVFAFFTQALPSFAANATQAAAKTEVAKEGSLEALFDGMYEAWNEHDIDKLFSFYSKGFITGDGINIEDYKELTRSLWEAYPNIKLENQK